MVLPMRICMKYIFLMNNFVDFYTSAIKSNRKYEKFNSTVILGKKKLGKKDRDRQKGKRTRMKQ